MTEFHFAPRGGDCTAETVRALEALPDGATMYLGGGTLRFGREGAYRGVFYPSNNMSGEGAAISRRRRACTGGS